MYNLNTIQNIPDIKDAILKDIAVIRIAGNSFQHSFEGFVSETGVYTNSLRTFLNYELSFNQKDYRIISITLYINGLVYPIVLSDDDSFSFLSDDYFLTLGTVQKRMRIKLQ